MLSLKTISRLLLSLVLFLVFFVGSNELRVAIGTISSWALGLVVHRRLRPSPTFLRNHLFFVFASFWLLAANNELFYENTLGRFLDVFFTWAFYDSETPGSGFTDWHETFTRRHRPDIAFACGFLRFAFLSTLAAVALPFVVFLCHWYAALPQRMPGLTESIEYLDRYGERPPWLQAQVLAPEPQPKRDTRYMRLSDDIIFVCGRGGGFERVVAGDYNGAISRRRRFSKDFA